MDGKYIRSLLIIIILLSLYPIGQGYAALPQAQDFGGTTISTPDVESSNAETTVEYIKEPTSSWPSITDYLLLPPSGQKANAFHMVVIGDSVAWGNGLNKEDKYYYLVADWLQKALKRPVDVTIYAHSGANISGDTGESIDPNFNSGYPTLMDQANSIQNKNDVDLILVSGGINDVGVMNIINVYTPAEKIDHRAQSIKDPMKILLSSLLSKCKNATIIVTNYYPIVSDNSDVTLIAALYGTAVFTINNVLNRDVLDAAKVKERLTENSYMFHGGATTALTNAVLETDNAGNRIAFANVNFKPVNCYAASETWLWKLVGLGPLPKTDDDLYEYRNSLCNPLNVADINRINAIGHPNRDGAKEYARAIESAIESKGLEWLQNESAVSLEADDTQESAQQVSLMASVESANQPSISWMKREFGEHSETSSIQQTSDGGYIIASSAEWDDIRLIKTDDNGNVIWDKMFEGPEEADMGDTDEKAFSVRQLSDGGYSILGSTQDVNGNFAWLIKTDSQGDLIWDKTVEEQGEIVSGRHTSDGGYIVATILPDESIGLSKIDSEGDKLWDKTFEETTFDILSESVQLPIEQTKDGGYLIACNRGNNGTLLIKIDDQGNELWNRLFSSPGPSMDSAYSAQQISDGGYIIAGTESRLDQSDIRHEHLNTYGALIKTDSSGNDVWNKTLDMYEDSKEDKETWIESIQQTNDGGYILAGNARAGDGPSYDECAWVIKTDYSGNIEWNKRFTLFIGTYWSISSIQQTSDGGYILCGDNNFYGPWLVKIDGNVDTTDMENNSLPITDKQDQQDIKVEVDSEENESNI